MQHLLVFRHNPEVFWDIFTSLWSKLLISFFIASPHPLFSLQPLLAHQFHYHHLLRCIPVWRLLRRGHLRDDLRHGLLRHLHDGDGQADPSCQLGLERESATCLTTQSYSSHTRTCVRSCTMLHILLPSFVQDLFRAGIGAVLYIITSLICVIGGAGDGARIAGGVSKSSVD